MRGSACHSHSALKAVDAGVQLADGELLRRCMRLLDDRLDVPRSIAQHAAKTARILRGGSEKRQRTAVRLLRLD